MIVQAVSGMLAALCSFGWGPFGQWQLDGDRSGSAVAASEAAVPYADMTGAPPAILESGSTPSPTRQRMGWFGLGLRLGLASTHLTPPASVTSSVNQASGGTYNLNDLNVSSTSRTLTPTMHLGGDGYFFKVDAPFTFAAEYTTYGLGLYPVNYGRYLDRYALFPYGSLGAVGNIIESRETNDPGTSNKTIGALLQGRLALGMKYFPLRSFALSFEAGYSPFAAGIMLLPPASGKDQTRPQGGYGSVLDFSLGAEWL